MIERIRITKDLFEPPTLWMTLTVLAFICLFVMWFLYAYFGDFNPRRRRISRRLQRLASMFRDAESQLRGSILRQMIDHARSSDQFTSCYAAVTLGQLATEFTSERPTIASVLIELLGHGDEFRRHAAAQALYDLGAAAEPYKDRIEKAIKRESGESADFIVERIIRNLNDADPWWKWSDSAINNDQ